MRSLSLAVVSFLYLSSGYGFSSESVSDLQLKNSFIMSRQDYGETRLNSSLSGGELSVGGKVYARGIGTHATSMIPINVEGEFFSGTVGIDDAAGNSGNGVEFRVLSGSRILWSSGRVLKGSAKPFEIKIPHGSKKIYLLALSCGNAVCDHANWLDLKWRGKSFATAGTAQELEGGAFGLQPSSEDSTKALCRALEALRLTGGVLNLEKGEYHFYRSNAHEMSFHISNHDQPEIHPVQIPLVDLRNVKIKGNGSTFIFHGKSLGVLFMDCEDVELEGVRLDYARSPYSEAKVLGFQDGKTRVSIDSKAFPYYLKDGFLRFVGEDWERGVGSVIAFRKGTKQIVERSADIYYNGKASLGNEGELLLEKDFSKEGAGVEVGDTLTLRTWDRPHPACVIYRAKDTSLKDVSIHSSFGMTLLAQRSENIRFVGTKSAEAKTAGMFPRPETGRVYSASADATHFSNVKGRVHVENAFFETMMDDAINVHSTCLSIEGVPADNQLLCRFKHGQAVGFEIFMPGDRLRFIKGPTLEQGSEVKIRDVRKLNTNELLITLDEAVPAAYGVGDAVENADYQCEVIFRGNIVQNNRARGSLFTTPKKVLVENNIFRNVAGSAILLAGDAQGWYESGPCEDIVIRNNQFVNNLSSVFQFTEAVISIYPEVRRLDRQKQFYHRNVLIEDNDFETFDVPLLFAISTKNLQFINNRIRYNNDFKAWGKPAFQFRRCAQVKIYGNEVFPRKDFSLKDCRISQMPQDEVSFKK